MHLTGLHLTGMHLTGVHLTGVLYRHASYRRVFYRLHLTIVSFTGVPLTGLHLTGVHRTGVHLSLARISHITRRAPLWLSHCGEKGVARNGWSQVSPKSDDPRLRNRREHAPVRGLLASFWWLFAAR